MHIPNPTKLRFGSNDSRINRSINANSKEQERVRSTCDDDKASATKSFEKTNANVNATFILNNSYITNNNNYSFDIYASNKANAANKNLNSTVNNIKKKVI